MDDRSTQKAEDHEILIFCDIDSFPLTRLAYEKAVEIAEKGGIFGLAQFSNHTLTKELYAGPMFLALSKTLWQELGEIDLRSSNIYDAAEALSVKARETGVALQILMPNCCIKPRWALSDKGIFGIGTFYGSLEFFHLFESRKKSSIELMTAVADDVLNRRSYDFNKYICILDQQDLCARTLGFIKYFIHRLYQKTRRTFRA